MSPDSQIDEFSKKATEILEKVFANVNSWLVFAETKNGTLLALNGAGVFGLVSVLKNSDYNGGWFFTLYLWMAIFFLCLGLMICLLSFSPITSPFDGLKKSLTHNTDNVNLLFYGDLVKYDNAKKYVVDIFKGHLKVDITESEVSKIHLDYANEILINSKITIKKYRFFKCALLSDILAVLSSVFVLFSYLCSLNPH